MKYLIVGNGDYARMMRRYLANGKSANIEGFVVPEEFITESTLDGLPIYSAERVLNLYQSDTCRLVMGIGYRNMNRIKEKEFLRYKNMGYHFINYIHSTAIIEDDVIIGEGNNIFEGVIIQEGVRIGNGNLVYGGSLIAHETVVGNFNSLSVKACVAGCSRIENNCFIGANATIRDHITLASYTLVGAGTYADKSTNPYAVVVGSKAKVLDDKKSVEFI